MKTKILNFAFVLAIAFGMNGCWSWQKTVSFGFWQSEDDIAEQKAEAQQEALIQECEKGDAISCNNSAVNFSTIKDFSSAKKFYEKACNGGLATACSNLGQIYEQGLVDEKKDIKTALELYKLACQNNDGVGCYNEALAIYDASSNDTDKIKTSLSLLAKSCELEYAQACYLLAKLSDNEAKAKALYKRACKLGKCME
ncbi:MAG: sel1 repeat family protein [Campylobacter sp.]|nr:sel1 repeat family protein [Campylobacter sp.]